MKKSVWKLSTITGLHKDTSQVANMFLQQQMSAISKRLDAMQAEMNARLNAFQAQMSNTVIATTAMGLNKSFLDVKTGFLNTYPRATGFLADVQYCNLYLLKFLKKISDENGIKFWLHAGTLIGALRHSGFIPWDDDVDIGMMRDDFDRLVALVAERDDCTINKYYNDITCSVSYQFKLNNLPVFIDIAVWDWTNAPNQAARTEFLDMFRRKRAAMVSDFHKKLGSPKPIDIGYYHLGPYAPKIQAKVDKLIQQYSDKLQPRLDAGDAVYLGMENYPFPYPVMAATEMFDLVESKFEDTTFLVPKNSQFYLDGYGDIYACPADIGQTPHLYAFEPYRDAIQQFVKERTNNE